MMNLKYLKITTPDINNGTGCRVTLWLPGCTHNCPGCHNKWTHNYNQGKKFTPEVEFYLYYELYKPYIAGLTISGGDPLDQNEEVLSELIEFLKRFRDIFKDSKDIWIYTGYEIEKLNKKQLEVLKYCDILVDGEYIEELRDISLAFRGSSNQRIIDLKNFFKEGLKN